MKLFKFLPERIKPKKLKASINPKGLWELEADTLAFKFKAELSHNEFMSLLSWYGIKHTINTEYYNIDL